MANLSYEAKMCRIEDWNDAQLDRAAAEIGRLEDLLRKRYHEFSLMSSKEAWANQEFHVAAARFQRERHRYRTLMGAGVSPFKTGPGPRTMQKFNVALRTVRAWQKQFRIYAAATEKLSQRILHIRSEIKRAKLDMIRDSLGSPPPVSRGR